MEIIKTDTLFGTKYLNLQQTTYKNKKGDECKWDWVQRVDCPRIVLIVPTVGDKIVLIKEFRVPLQDYEWGFPAGLVDEGETIENAIKRELKEETGLDVRGIGQISSPVFNSAGLTDEAIIIAFVEATGEINTKANEASEEINVFLFDDKQIREFIFDPTKKFGAKAWVILLLWLSLRMKELI